MVETLRVGVEWAQNLSTIPKVLISSVLILLCGLAIIVLWQKPPETVPEKEAPGSTNQTGYAASSGQSGGVNAGLYINQAPPVTEQQKAEALLSLQSEIEELAEFPNRQDLPAPRTLLEQASTIKLPHQLFIIVNRYYKSTILAVPKVGRELYAFKTLYYNYENAEYDFEINTTVTIGTLVNVEFKQAWALYFQYFLLRAAGLSQKQIIEGGNFLNYSITWDGAEKIYSEHISKATIADAVKENLSRRDSVMRAANGIIDTYKGP